MTTNRTAAIASYEADMAAANTIRNLSARRAAITTARANAAAALDCRVWELPRTTVELAARTATII